MPEQNLVASPRPVKAIPFVFIEPPPVPIAGMTFIYGLIDPRSKLLRYIGRTIDLRDRINSHKQAAVEFSSRHVCQWIKSLWRKGLTPHVVLIEACHGEGAAEEIFHIALARADGLDLTNATDGGDGGTNCPPINSKVADMIGKPFGRLTVVRPHHRSPKYVWYFECLCACGNRTIVKGGHLRDGLTESCGCKKAEMTSERSRTHGMKDTREYHSWCHMRGRCLNPSNLKYPDYGGRGITICQRWLDSFENFYADMGPCPDGFTLDRRDNDGNYEPGNCQWASPADQSRNKRNNIWLTLGDRTLCLSDWAREIGIGAQKLKKRLQSGWSIEKALTTPRINRLPRCSSPSSPSPSPV